MFEPRTIQGAYFAISAYVFWGFVPIYFKWMDHVSPWEIVCHRVIWSVVLLLGILHFTGQLKALRVEASVLKRLAVTSLLISANWLVYIYAIINEHIVETTLGYFINPLVSVFLGMMFLSERMRPLQWIAIGMAALGIAYQLIYFGAIPWIALWLAFSFGFYGLMRKNMNLPSVVGLALETMMILPFALIGLLWLYINGEADFGSLDRQTDLLLMLGGFVTSFPLLCFAAAVVRLPLSIAGMFQYIAPTISIFVAVLMYNEPFGLDRFITFACIWVALIIFTAETLYHHRKIRLLTS
ncbi:MAG: EamA family transporter RarD [Pseudomonadales bacterium]